MATFYERLQLYIKYHPTPTLGKKRIKRLSNSLAVIWDKRKQTEQFTYVDSIEDGQVYTVRNYPEKYTPTIDVLIHRFHQELIINLAKEPTPKKISSPPPLKKERKRMPIKGKPIWSTKSN